MYVCMSTTGQTERSFGYLGRTVNRVFLIHFSRHSFFPQKLCIRNLFPALCLTWPQCVCASESMKTSVFLGQSPYYYYYYYYQLFMLDFSSLVTETDDFFIPCLCVSLFFNLISMYLLFCISMVFWGGWRGERGDLHLFTIWLKIILGQNSKCKISGSKNMCI